MADRFPAQIWIGGQLSRSKRLYPDDPDDDTTVIQGLIGALHSDGASHEYGEAEIRSDYTEKGLFEYLDGDVLHFKNDQACNGEFEETEEFCIEHGIPFDRQSHHYDEYDAENVYWRPSMNSPTIRYADASGNEIVCGDTVRQAIEKLEGGLLMVGMNLLHEACPELPPKLEKFEIIA